jgi:hypothetical protein
LTTGIYFGGKVGDVSHNKVDPKPTAESASDNFQRLLIALWTSTPRRTGRWITSIGVAFGAADCWKLIAGDKPAGIFLRRVVPGIILQ